MMKTDLETIENYLTGQLSSDERTQFESALRTDPEVAEALTFYLTSKQVAKRQAYEERKAELEALLKASSPTVRPLWNAPMRWAAAACVVLLLGLGWFFLRPDDTAVLVSQLTDEYITEHFTQLPTTMDGGSADSLKIGVGLFNDGKLAEAEAIFQGILARQPDNDNALNYAGIVSLRQGDYDKAITLFNRLSQRTDLVANPGTFYEALAHLKRAQPLDKSQAKKLLDEVITKNLEGKEVAESLQKELR